MNNCAECRNCYYKWEGGTFEKQLPCFALVPGSVIQKCDYHRHPDDCCWFSRRIGFWEITWEALLETIFGDYE